MRRMDQSALPRTDHPATDQDALAELPAGDFVRRWRQITGEPPAILLNSRSEMIALLVESVPIAPLTPPERIPRIAEVDEVPSQKRGPAGPGTPDPG